MLMLRLVRAVLGLARGIHPALAWKVGELIGHAAGALPLRDVRRTREHLARAFPERDAVWLDRTVRRTWRHFAGMALWTVVTARADTRNLRRHAVVEGADHLRDLARAVRRGQGTVVFSGHLGNWELLPRLMSTLIPCTVIGKKLRSAVVDAVVRDLRTSHGLGGQVRVAYQDDDVRVFLRDLRAGIPVATLNDQDIDRLDGVFVPWFRQPAYTPVAPAALAQVARVPVQCVFLLRRHGRWVVHASPRVAFPRAADRAAQQLAITAWATAYEEQVVRGLPHEWAWWHKRWRTRPEDRPEALGAGLVRS